MKLPASMRGMTDREPFPVVGELVTLKSGGPPMTVARVERLEDGGAFQVQCAWHDQDGQLFREWFDHRTLKTTMSKPKEAKYGNEED